MEKKIIKLLNIKIVFMNILFTHVNINEGNYMPPLDHGYSIEMKENSVNTYSIS